MTISPLPFDSPRSAIMPPRLTKDPDKALRYDAVTEAQRRALVASRGSAPLSGAAAALHENGNLLYVPASHLSPSTSLVPAAPEGFLVTQDPRFGSRRLLMTAAEEERALDAVFRIQCATNPKGPVLSSFKAEVSPSIRD